MEIALLIATNDDKCYNWHIGYTEVFTRLDKEATDDNFESTEWEETWWHDTSEAFQEMINGFTIGKHIIHVEGLEKTLWMRHWFDNMQNADVIEICNIQKLTDGCYITETAYERVTFA